MSPKAPRKRAVVQAKRPADDYTCHPGAASPTVLDKVVESVRGAGTFTTGDQIPPAAILWPDPARLWEPALKMLQGALPELFALGDYTPDQRTGPAIWLRCVAARTMGTELEADQVPVFYLPGVSRQDLRAVEECPEHLQPLVDLLFRGAMWIHPNGREWTPLAFLGSEHGGLGFDVARDADTTAALQRALPALAKERVTDLQGQRLDAAGFNALLTPDLPQQVLRWMNAPVDIKARKTRDEWRAFCDQCLAELSFHPDKDGELRAATLLGQREGEWQAVWLRFREAATRYPGVILLLEQASPQTEGTLVFEREPWPLFNARSEKSLVSALLALHDVSFDIAVSRVQELEREHAPRRNWIWRELGRSQLAVALEHLATLSRLATHPLAGVTAVGMATDYANHAWQVDAAALSALACGKTPEEDAAIATGVRALYLHWLDESARNLQSLCRLDAGAVAPRLTVEAGAGRILLFADGLRFDVARAFESQLQKDGLTVALDWDWAPLPTVTSTGKPFVTPVAGRLTGGSAGDEFTPQVQGTEQVWTQDRMRTMFDEGGIQVLDSNDTGNPAGKAWTEAGTLDNRGHNEGWKVAKQVDPELRDLAARVRALIGAGWREVLVVTDHGWLLMPGGLPKVELSKHLVDHRWGRCAAMRDGATCNLPTFPWHWNRNVTVACPPGAGSFRAGVEYTHGGISLQEMVVPRLRVSVGAAGAEVRDARISGVKWVGLRCRVTIAGKTDGLCMDIRARAADPASSQIEGAQAREVGADGTVSLPMADDRNIGQAALIVLLAANGTVCQTQATVIGGET